MAISPQRLFTVRCSRLIEEALLCYQHEWALVMSTLRHFPLPGGDFVQISTHMDGSSPTTCCGPPWNRSGERIIHFENAGRVLEALESAAVARGQPCARHARELPRCHVEQDDACSRQLLQINDASVEFNCAAELA